MAELRLPGLQGVAFRAGHESLRARKRRLAPGSPRECRYMWSYIILSAHLCSRGHAALRNQDTAFAGLTKVAFC